jgi:hypothetical protein
VIDTDVIDLAPIELRQFMTFSKPDITSWID